MRLLYLFLFTPVFFFSQDTLKLSYGEKLDFGTKILDYNFKLIHESSKEFHVHQNQINAFVFPLSGLYTVLPTEIEESNHHSHGHDCSKVQFTEKFYVLVDEVSISFDYNSLSISRPIQKNVNTEGISISVNVDIISKDNKLVKMNMTEVGSAGIGTSIKANLDSKFAVLNPGKHKLIYHLSGVCTEKSFIQFDFKTHNGNIVPIGLTTQVTE